MQSSETVWCECRKSRNGARNAIESFLTKQALDVLRGPLVTILARYMRLKIDIFSTNFKEIFPSAASHVIGRPRTESNFRFGLTSCRSQNLPTEVRSLLCQVFDSFSLVTSSSSHQASHLRRFIRSLTRPN